MCPLKSCLIVAWCPWICRSAGKCNTCRSDSIQMCLFIPILSCYLPSTLPVFLQYQIQCPRKCSCYIPHMQWDKSSCISNMQTISQYNNIMLEMTYLNCKEQIDYDYMLTCRTWIQIWLMCTQVNGPLFICFVIFFWLLIT